MTFAPDMWHQSYGMVDELAKAADDRMEGKAVMQRISKDGNEHDFQLTKEK